MNSKLHRSHPILLGVSALAAVSFLASCGSDDDKDSDSTTAATTAATTAGSEAEEETEESYAIVSDAEVSTGYANLIAKMTTLSTDPTAANAEALEEVHEIWEGFEGTVKQNDADAYLASEEALDSFLTAGEGGDTEGMVAAVTKMSTTAAAYLAKFPG